MHQSTSSPEALSEDNLSPNGQLPVNVLEDRPPCETTETAVSESNPLPEAENEIFRPPAEGKSDW